MSKTLKTIILSSLFFLPTTTFGAFRFVPRLLAATERPTLAAIFNSCALSFKDLPSEYKEICVKKLVDQNSKQNAENIEQLLTEGFHEYFKKICETYGITDKNHLVMVDHFNLVIVQHAKLKEDFMQALKDEQDKQ